MDEASGIIAELRQKLKQLDRKVLLYRREMTAEFKKYAEELLRDVPEIVSGTVSKAIAESLKRYPLIDPDWQNDQVCGVEVDDVAADHVTTYAITTPGTTAIPVPPHRVSVSPVAEGQSQLHEREKEFHGLFIPSYLPLLDVGNLKEERPILDDHSQPGTDSKSISVASRGRSSEERSIATATLLYSSPHSVPACKPLTAAQRNTEEEPLESDHNDIHARRSALRRLSSSSKPASPRHVRFEFEGQEFPTTSSPQLEGSGLDGTTKDMATTPAGDGCSDEAMMMQQVKDSPHSGRLSSTQALQALSRGRLEDDGTKWTEVSAPSDGSTSVPTTVTEIGNSDGVGTLSILLTKRPAISIRTNGHAKGVVISHDSTKATPPSPTTVELISTEDNRKRNIDDPGDNTPSDEDSHLEEIPLLEYVRATTPMVGGSTLAALEGRYADIAQIITTATSSKPRFSLENESDLNGPSGSPLQLTDDEVFAFDEAPPRSFKDPAEEMEESDSISSETEGESPRLGQYATSPAVPIVRPGTPPPMTKSSASAKSSSHRSSYHPFNTPIVSEAIHAQAASLGHVATFVGSLHGASGLDESDMQSFRGSGGIGSFAGGVPRSFSERLAMEESTENQHVNQRNR